MEKNTKLFTTSENPELVSMNSSELSLYIYIYKVPEKDKFSISGISEFYRQLSWKKCNAQ